MSRIKELEAKILNRTSTRDEEVEYDRLKTYEDDTPPTQPAKPRSLWPKLYVYESTRGPQASVAKNEFAMAEPHEYVPAADLAAAEAEREYWQKDSAAAWNKCEERRLAQVKAEAERDEALGLLERLLNDTAHMQSKHAAKMNREIAALLAKAGAGHGGRG